MNARRDLSLLGWLIGGVAASMMLALVLKLSPMESRPASAACQGGFTINFDGLAHGAVIQDQYAAQGVQIAIQANEGFPDAIIVFDTNMPPTSNVRPMRWTELSTLVNICDCPIVVASPLACTRARKVNTDDLT